MTTKVFIDVQQKEVYKTYVIQFLKARYENSDYLETFCRLSFQSGGRDGNTDYYGMAMIVESDKIEDFLQAAKILKEIDENRDNSNPQPEEILRIVQAVEHVRYKGGYIPRSYHGLKVFNVMDGTSLYTRIFAATEPLARKQFNKSKYESMDLVFDSIVEI
jgi:hypothetical protein